MEFKKNNKFEKKNDNLQIGEVLIGLYNIKRIAWPLGKVEELYKGKDSIHRVARIKMTKGELFNHYSAYIQ